MTHVHFDLSEIERKFRAMHARMNEQSATLSNPYAGEIESAVATVFEGVLPILMLTPRLRNEGRDDHFIAHVYGAIIANVMLNALMASSSMGASAEIIIRRINRVLDMIRSGDQPPGSLLGSDNAVGTTGGRA